MQLLTCNWNSAGLNHLDSEVKVYTTSPSAPSLGSRYLNESAIHYGASIAQRREGIHTVGSVRVVRGQVLQHRSVEELVELHSVIWEQVPAHTQRGLRRRVCHLGVDDRRRRSWKEIKRTEQSLHRSFQWRIFYLRNNFICKLRPNGTAFLHRWVI